MKCLRLVCVSVFLVLGACVLVQREMESRRSLLSLDDTAQCRWLVGKTPCRSPTGVKKKSGWLVPRFIPHGHRARAAKRDWLGKEIKHDAIPQAARIVLVNAGRLLRDQSIRRSAAGEGER